MLRTLARRAPAVAGVLVCVAVAGCSSGAEEPPGLDALTSPATTAATPAGDGSESPAESDATPTDGSRDGSSPQPEASFTQPHVPTDEPRVIELDNELPVQAPADASDAELEVLEAAGRFMASWQAVLFGADEERAGLRDTATGDQLDRLVELVGGLAAEEWVFVGEPMQLEALAVTVSGGAAQVDLCLAFPEWLEIRGGQAQPYPSPERYLVDIQLVDGRWLASDTTEGDASACSG